MSVIQKIGKSLQAQRKKAGLTQDQLSERIGISPNYLSAVERGVNQLSYEILVQAINVLGCSADDIFGEVIDHALPAKVCELSDRLEGLEATEKARILAVLETLIDTAKQK